jgi:membrane protein implicated in regulation of membrane protease activity
VRSRWVPALAIAYFILMLVAVTYPGYVPFNDIHPFVFGLPFSLFWQVLWVCGSVLVLTLVYLWERRSSLAPSSGLDERDEASSDRKGRNGLAPGGGR